ncbi:conserved hypothetical protein [Ricinus communis]|uniref:Uncharacterized protein n=1 Tax=Ricinus communis TaxID=3988 RepID=B9SBJ9_RICCO|nr:conserved hypothetical protein [Ricinus communis]
MWLSHFHRLQDSKTPAQLQLGFDTFIISCQLLSHIQRVGIQSWLYWLRGWSLVLFQLSEIQRTWYPILACYRLRGLLSSLVPIFSPWSTGLHSFFPALASRSSSPVRALADTDTMLNIWD